MNNRDQGLKRDENGNVEANDIFQPDGYMKGYGK